MKKPLHTTYHILHTSFAFTLVELMVVIGIIMILAAVAFTGSSGLIRDLRFSNTFNKPLFMLQSARNAAATGKNSAAASYRITFDLKNQQILSEILDQNNASQTLETFTVDPITNLAFSGALPDKTPCTNLLHVLFANGSAQTTLICNNNSVPVLMIQMSEGQARSKSFMIHKAAGIPQVLP